MQRLLEFPSRLVSSKRPAAPLLRARPQSRDGRQRKTPESAHCIELIDDEAERLSGAVFWCPGGIEEWLSRRLPAMPAPAVDSTRAESWLAFAT